VFHAQVGNPGRGNPYGRLLDFLEELSALRGMNIVSPDQRSAWLDDPLKKQREEVGRCIRRFEKLDASLAAGRARCAAYWMVQLGGAEYPIREIVRAVLGKSPPPIAFEEWSITTTESSERARSRGGR
jgi:hypothetical protein